MIEQTALFDEPQGWIVPAGYIAELRTTPARCRSCDAEVAWATTPAGKRMPLNRDGSSHFSTCPDANTWRKPR